MDFVAEIKTVKSRKTVSLDIEYTVQFITSDPNVLSLGAMSPDQTVKVKVEPNG